ncbi:MAG: rod shape-determining protein MreC [Elusimicrobia bacterium]|nr:rod shape-determining protein MreC [Elusimicrobiota bacterium]
MNKDRRLANLFFAAFSILSLLLLLLPVSTPLRAVRALAAYTVLPALSWTDSASRYLSGVPENVSSLLNAEQENRRLRDQNKELELLRSRLNAALEANARLQESLRLSDEWKWDGVWAFVVEHNRERWYSTVILNKGESDGIALHSPALAVSKSSAAIAGKIIEVYPHTSKLLLVTDPMFSVTSSVDGFDALAEGQGKTLLRLNYLSPELKIEPGAELRTSVASPVFPPGIMVGTVLKVYQAQKLTPYVYADVSPAIPPGELKEVFVIAGKKAKK